MKSAARPHLAKIERLEGEWLAISIPAVQDFPVIEKQEEWVWCWAACAAMLSKLGDRPETQAQIAERIHGLEPESEPGVDPVVRVKAAVRYEVMCAMLPELRVDRFENIWDGIKDQVRAAPGILLNPEVDVNSQALLESRRTTSCPTAASPSQTCCGGIRSWLGCRNPIRKWVMSICFMGQRFAGAGASATSLPTLRIPWPSCGETTLPPGTCSGASGLRTDEIAPDNYEIGSVKLIDPWGPDVKELTFEELSKRLEFSLSSTYAHKQLSGWRTVAGIGHKDR